ncbi:MFS transporter [Lichenicoccus roseus]|uniref:MFS transporter n=1 Tax=Lichenicoccus roseus TaxID=2683649 RepID=A0A5R9J1S4_9PROT|nr:MFS transporter [Lichenicoccus roseus]TLU70919.1 MFS transporter [Lichenicoccus roseus]
MPATDAAPAVTNQSAIRMFVDTRLGVLRERDCRLFFIGFTASLAGSSMVPVALSFVVLKGGHGSGAVGAVLAAETIPLVLLLLLGGAIADRMPRHRVMIAADVLRLLSETLLTILLVSGHPAVWVIMLLSATLGVGQAFFNPSLTGFVPQIVSGERLQDANALLGLSKAVARVSGPGIAGVLIATVGAWSAVAADAMTYAVSLFCLVRLRPRPAEKPEPEPVRIGLIKGWQGFRERRWLWSVVAQGGLAQLFTFSPFLVIGATLFSHGSGSIAWGAILAADGVGGLAGALFAMRLRPKRPLVVALLGSLGLAGTPILLALHAPLPLLLAVSVISGAGVALFLSLFDTVIQRNVPETLLSRVSAYNWLGTIALSPLGFALAGPAAHLAGPSAVLLFGGCFAIVSTLALFAVPAVRQLPWRDE